MLLLFLLLFAAVNQFHAHPQPHPHPHPQPQPQPQQDDEEAEASPDVMNPSAILPTTLRGEAEVSREDTNPQVL